MSQTPILEEMLRRQWRDLLTVVLTAILCGTTALVVCWNCGDALEPDLTFLDGLVLGCLFGALIAPMARPFARVIARCLLPDR